MIVRDKLMLSFMQLYAMTLGRSFLQERFENAGIIVVIYKVVAKYWGILPMKELISGMEVNSISQKGRLKGVEADLGTILTV